MCSVYFSHSRSLVNVVKHLPFDACALGRIFLDLLYSNSGGPCTAFSAHASTEQPPFILQVVLLEHHTGTNEEPDVYLRNELESINGNEHLSEHYLQLAREMDVMEPKVPDDVYKAHLVEGRAADGAVDSARKNLASTFVNAFLNAGYGTDKLVTAAPAVEGSSEVQQPEIHPSSQCDTALIAPGSEHSRSIRMTCILGVCS